MRNFLATLAFAAFAVICSFAQPGVLVSSTKVGTISAADFNQRLKKLYGEASPAEIDGSLNLYKVTYRSLDVNGKSTILSGLVVIPENGAPNGLIVFNHGTMVWRKASPSMYRGEDKDSEVQYAILAFGSGGYAIAMPDYIGLGDHKANAHPFPASVVNARAGIDLIRPAREIARRGRLTVGRQLFITGYSEGGGVAMAQTRLLEQMSNPDFRVTASAPLAGPYDLSGTTIDFLSNRNTDQVGFLVRCYLIGYAVHSLSKNSGINVSDYFKPALRLTINLAYTGNVSDDDILKRLGVTTVLMRANNDMFNVITPRFKQVIESRNQRDPLIKLLKANDTFDWSPQNPMLLVALATDTVVDPRNTDVAFQTMRRRGVGRNILRKSIIRNGSLNHLTAMPESLLRARLFFDR
ncbi:MAG TPA: hypothetical protein VNK26_03925, partial [Pyrinomonadaceae bacterium]|nr:hypothetical protein [Pyrinomonadaceae bacterium]